jgi:hypothetical protein
VFGPSNEGCCCCGSSVLSHALRLINLSFVFIPDVVIYYYCQWLGNNAGAAVSEREAGAAATAKTSYRRLFPHHPLALDSTNGNNANSSTTTTTTEATTAPAAVYHAFTVGTVRFILSDMRSESTDASMFSTAQGEWLRHEFDRANEYDFVIWVTSKPWIGTAQAGEDAWWGHPADRAKVSDWINNNGMNGTTNPAKNILAISADAHMLAFDNGANTNYGSSSSTSTSFPILQSGPLDNVGSVKGGPFTSGCHAYSRERNNQFSIIRFVFTPDDNNDNDTNDTTTTTMTTSSSSCIDITGYRMEGDRAVRILHETLCGPDITAPSVSSSTGPVVGSCEIPRFRRSTMTLLVVSVLVAVMGLAVTICYFRDCYAAFLVFVGYAATFAVGIATPFGRGVKTLDVWPTFTILLVQSTTVLILLVVRWRGGITTTASSPPTRRRRMTTEEPGEVEEHSKHNNDDDDDANIAS